MKVLRKQKVLAVLAIMFIGFNIALVAKPAMAVDGQIDITVSSIVAGDVIGIKAKNLAVSTAYAVYVGSTNLGNWTTGATTANNVVFRYTIDKPASGNLVTVYLYSGATTVDSATVSVTEVTSLLPTTLLILIGVGLLIMYTFVRILRGLSAKY